MAVAAALSSGASRCSASAWTASSRRSRARSSSGGSAPRGGTWTSELWSASIAGLASSSGSHYSRSRRTSQSMHRSHSGPESGRAEADRDRRGTAISLGVMRWLAAPSAGPPWRSAAARWRPMCSTTACWWLSLITLAGVGLNTLADGGGGSGRGARDDVVPRGEGGEAWRGDGVCRMIPTRSDSGLETLRAERIVSGP